MSTTTKPQSNLATGVVKASNLAVTFGPHVQVAGVNKMAVGDVHNMTPTNANAQYGIVNVSSPFNQTVTWSGHYAGKSQNLTGMISGQFFVYHEANHGLDDYLVVFVEQSIVSMNAMIADEQLGRGFFLHRVDSQVAPSDARCGWVNSSPATVNQSQTQTSSVSSSYTTSVTVGVNKDGGSGSMTSSETDTIGSSTTVNITDWNVTELTDGASGTGKWMWFQNRPWGGDVETSDFGWWQNAYNCGGGWDDTKELTQISKTSLQYTSTISWRMPGSLVQNGSLPVTFNGSSKYYFAAINMPQCDNCGHHQIQWNQPVNAWSVTIDLAKIAKAT